MANDKGGDSADVQIASVDKPYKVTVLVISESNGVVNQKVVGQEGAVDEKELVMKHMAIGKAVADAFYESCNQLAKAGGYLG